MPYSKVEDLLIEDLLLGANVDPNKYVQLASNDIDSKLGWRYTLPLTPLSGSGTWEDLPQHEVLLLQSVNNRLASGELILALDLAEENASLHSYGLYLVKKATDDLNYLANGEIVLSALPFNPGEEAVVDKSPGIKQYDSESLLLGFENTVLRSDIMPAPWYSRPGEIK